MSIGSDCRTRSTDRYGLTFSFYMHYFTSTIFTSYFQINEAGGWPLYLDLSFYPDRATFAKLLL